MELVRRKRRGRELAKSANTRGIKILVYQQFALNLGTQQNLQEQYANAQHQQQAENRLA